MVGSNPNLNQGKSDRCYLYPKSIPKNVDEFCFQEIQKESKKRTFNGR